MVKTVQWNQRVYTTLVTCPIQWNYYLATNYICPAARYKSVISEYQGL